MKAARFIFLLLPLLLLPLLSLADAPVGYYDTVDLTNSAALRTSLHNLIDGHVRYPYTSYSTDTWDILETADEFPIGANTILDIYRNGVYTKIGGGVGPYNREHSWPKSYGFSSSSTVPYTDCHHLFLCDSGYNSSRGNRPFDYCINSCSIRATDVNNGAGGSGQSNLTGSNNGVLIWETWDGRKGDVARAMFYMDVRYSGDVPGEPDLVLTDDAALIQVSNSSPAYMGMLSTLIEWNDLDPVDAREMRHNDVVYFYQGNRNPFIDHPEYVSGVFLGGIADVDESLPGLNDSLSRIVDIYPNPFNPTTRIELSLERAGVVRVQVYTLNGKIVHTLLNESRQPGRITLTWDGRDDTGKRVPSGAYFCRLQSGEHVDTRKIMLLK